MSETIKINGTETEFASLTVQMSAGLEGATANITFISGLHLKPAKKDKVEISLGGVVFTGIVDDCQKSYEGNTKFYTVTVLGPQHHLTNAPVSYAGNQSISDTLTALLAETPLAVAVLGTATDPVPFSFTGNLREALDTFNSACGGFTPFLHPAGILYWINRNDGYDPAPGSFTPGQYGYQLKNFREAAGTPPTQFKITGRNPKPNGPSDPDTVAYAFVTAGDGITTDFKYEDTVTEITGVFVDSHKIDLCDSSDPDASSFEVVNFADEKTVKFQTPPADTKPVEIRGTKHYATSVLTDTTLQTELATRFGGEEIHQIEEAHPELKTQAEVDAYCASLKTRLNIPHYEITAEVWGAKDAFGNPVEAGIYEPRYKVQINDDDGFNDTLPISHLSAVREAGKWIQTVTAGTGEPTARIGGIKQIARRIKKATTAPQPPAPTTTVKYQGPRFNTPRCLAFDADGNLYVSDSQNYRIRKISPENILSTYGGTGINGHDGDGGAVASAQIWGTFLLTDLRFHNDRLYFSGLDQSSDGTGPGIRVIDLATGNVDLFGGDYVSGFSTDGANATDSHLNYPRAITWIDNNLYISQGSALGDSSVGIWKISGGNIHQVQFTSPYTYFYSGMDSDGTDLFGSAGNDFVKYEISSDTYSTISLSVPLYDLSGVVRDPVSGDFFALGSDDSGSTVQKIWKIQSDGTVTHFGGTGTEGYSGDGGLAVDAEFFLSGGYTVVPYGMAVNGGFLYFSDIQNHCIRRINLATGIIELFAGSPGKPGFAGDGGSALPG